MSFIRHLLESTFLSVQEVLHSSGMPNSRSSGHDTTPVQLTCDRAQRCMPLSHDISDNGLEIRCEPLGAILDGLE